MDRGLSRDCLNAAIYVCTFFFLRETRGLNLEEISHNDFKQMLDYKTVDLERVDYQQKK